MQMIDSTRAHDLFGSSLIIDRGGRRILLEQVEQSYRVRAMVQLGYDPEVARVFCFSGAERSKVMQLARRKRVIQ